ncbi:hypothetical protein [Flavobacterium pedocola]
MKYLQLLFSLIFTITIFYFVIKWLILLNKDRRKIKTKLGLNYIETSDLRIWAMYRRTFIIDFGENYQYAKFTFTNDEVYIYLRNSLPKTYVGPFVLKANESSNYSYLTKFYITKLQFIGSDLKIHFKHKYFIGVKYGLSISGVNDIDIEKIKSNLC